METPKRKNAEKKAPISMYFVAASVDSLSCFVNAARRYEEIPASSRPMYNVRRSAADDTTIIPNVANKMRQ